MKHYHFSTSVPTELTGSGGATPSQRRSDGGMGRRKVEIKKIEDKNSRQVTFSKRRAGLIKKAKQLSILCDVDIAVVIFSSRGKLFEFCSTDSLANILHRYNSSMEVKGQEGAGAHAETKNLNGKGYLTIKELLEQAERVSGQPDVDQLNLSDLVNLEEQLQDALAETRSKKNRDLMQHLAGLTEMEMTLSEENKHLKNKVAEAGSSQNVKKKGITLELLGDDGLIPGQHKECPMALKLL